MATIAERLKVVREEHKPWALRNFGGNPIRKGFRNLTTGQPIGLLAPLMGMTEELGELSGALLDMDHEEIEDALGDILIYFVNFANDGEVTLVLDETLDYKRMDPLGILCLMIQPIGKINHAILKRCQGIRGFEVELKMADHLDSWGDQLWRALDIACDFWCEKRAIDILEKVWAKVKERDWVKHRKTGGAPTEFHEFDSSLTCNYCGATAESIRQNTGQDAERVLCPKRL